MAIRLLRTLPRLISIDSNRSFIDAVSMAVKLAPIRYVTPNTGSVLAEGSIYGVESAEDTSEAGQKIHPRLKALLVDLIPAFLNEFELLVQKNTEVLLSRLEKRNVVLSGLFLLAHSVSSFRQTFEDSDASEDPIPQPPSLKAAPRPRIKIDRALQEVMESATSRISALVGLCGYSSVSLLWWSESSSAAVIRNASEPKKEDFSSNIEVPDVGVAEHHFDPVGVAACLLELMMSQDSIPTQWLLYHPTAIIERLLPLAKSFTLSRSAGGPLFIQAILSYHPEHIQYEISYPLDYILENEILPAAIPQKVYYAIRACIEFAIRMPDTRLRQQSFASLSGLVSLFEGNSQFKILYLLSKTCPYPSAQSAIVHLMKEAFLRQHQESLPQGSSSMDVDSKNPASTTKAGNKPTFALLSDDLFFHYFAKEALKLPGLEQRFDSIIAALNFLRAILLRDARTRVCSLWTSPSTISKFKQEVIVPLTSSVLQIIAQHQRDDSYLDRQRIQKELSSKGAGELSMDQLADSQSQSILNWQLAHSILLRIEELLI